ncbi:hypothetical protein BB560_000744 [Smittium megazygosporum]|uniref:RNI-like protein n=1 Tax=Smittium megazygosporum TaxID=133381 RepID=A0A2T9ZJI0_9FUNG|nr:hypothetical protein BB560_000744 [Smittium megazygosporum]
MSNKVNHKTKPSSPYFSSSSPPLPEKPYMKNVLEHGSDPFPPSPIEKTSAFYSPPLRRNSKNKPEPLNIDKTQSSFRSLHISNSEQLESDSEVELGVDSYTSRDRSPATNSKYSNRSASLSPTQTHNSKYKKESSFGIQSSSSTSSCSTSASPPSKHRPSSLDLSPLPSSSPVKQIRRVRFVRPQTFISYDSEDGTVVETDIDISEKKQSKITKFLSSSWSLKRASTAYTSASPDISSNNRSINFLLSSYKKSCLDFEEQQHPSIIAILKAASKNNELLTSIKISNQKTLTKNIYAFAELLELSKDLNSLELVDCQLDDHFTKVISISLVGLDKLRSINLANNSDITHTGLNYLALAVPELKSLRSLNFSGLHLDLEAARSISEAISLISLRDLESGNDRSISLHLDNCTFSLQSLEKILSSVKSSSVRKLFLRKNKFGKPHVSSIKRLLKHSIQGSRSDFSSIASHESSPPDLPNLPKETSDSIYADEKASIISPISSSSHIRVLDLSDNSFGDSISELSRALKYNTNLKALFLRRCNISPTNLVGFVKGVLEGSSLSSLDLSKNHLFGKNSKKELLSITSLISYSNIEFLSLEDCGINELVAIQIAGAISNSKEMIAEQETQQQKQQPSASEFSPVSLNESEPSSLSMFLSTRLPQKSISSIKHLSLANNNCVTKRSLHAFIKAAEKNQGIENIKLSVHIGNEEHRALEMRLSSICSRNTTANIQCSQQKSLAFSK